MLPWQQRTTLIYSHSQFLLMTRMFTHQVSGRGHILLHNVITIIIGNDGQIIKHDFHT